MKIFFLLLLFILSAGIFISCKKETSCEGCIDGNRSPIAVAGPDQAITLPTDSISLDGSSSSDPDGKIIEWLWKKIDGPASFTIANSAVAKTKAKNLVAGTYQFELTVKDDKGLSAKDTMQVSVDAVITTDHPPVANAGNDTTITLPSNTVNLDGSKSSDPDNNITSYQWSKISGPSSFNITNASAVQTQVTNLVEGVYRFELKVTDGGGWVAKDTVQVTVILPYDPAIDIYVAGSENGVAKYWKNGTAVSVIGGSTINDIVVANGDVYTAGEQENFDMEQETSTYWGTAKYWKNGTMIFTDGREHSSASSIAVVGNDVYVTGGYDINNSFLTTAVYWKNGVEVSLGNGFASSIAVRNNDVYVAGSQNDGQLLPTACCGMRYSVAKYWKNGVAISLTDGTEEAYASSITVVGSDVYVAGYEGNYPYRVAKYWKNGVAVSLTDGTEEAYASSITVVGSDVYVAGYEGPDLYPNRVAKYWKNGVAMSLGNGYASSITVVDNNVYVAGGEWPGNWGYGTKYWKNGVAVPLTGGTERSQAKSNVVVKH